MEDKIDRFGLCPNCKKSWDGGDVFEQVSILEANIGKSQTELKNLAANFGWTPENKVHFSKAKVVELIDGTVLIECPNMLCQHVFNRYTGEEYKSMFDAKINKPVHYSADRLTSATVEVMDMSEESKPGLQEQGLKLHVTKENRFEIEKILADRTKANEGEDECPFDL